jgi:hypothetical protein
VKGRVSHVFYYLSKQVENPQPKTYVYITQDYISPLIPPLTQFNADGTTAQNSGVQLDLNAAATGAAATTTTTPSNPRWTPFGPSANTNAPTVTPTDPTATGTTPAKKKYRYEFVLVFIWRDPASTTPAAPTPPGSPTPPVSPGK